MNKLINLINSFINIFKKDVKPRAAHLSEEDYDGWLGI